MAKSKKNNHDYRIRTNIDRHINQHSFLFPVKERWYCGVTNNTTVRKGQHKRAKGIPCMYFKAWDAGSRTKSVRLEEKMHSKGFNGKARSEGGVRKTTKKVYVFKQHTTILDDLKYLLGRTD